MIQSLQGDHPGKEKGPPMVKILWRCGVHPSMLGKGPQPSTSAGMSSQELEPPADSVTWPSDPEHYGKELPSNHRKRLYFIRKWQPLNGQRSS